MKDCFGTIDRVLQPSINLWVALLALFGIKSPVFCYFLWSFRERMLSVFSPSLANTSGSCTWWQVRGTMFSVVLLASQQSQGEEHEEEDVHES